jgi:D-alanyl-lipoteichoic acid acyltransferase DltB (MBOAT superfamily)
MPLVSPQFALFFVLVALLWFVLAWGWRWPFLLLASIVFFILSAGVESLILPVVVTLVTYEAGRIIGRVSGSSRRLWLWGGVGFNLALLVISQTLDTAPLVPLGVSFYTFGCIAYLVDIYRRKTQPEAHAGHFATYVAFFPKLVAGPIERVEHFLPQLAAPKGFDEARVVEGLRRILWGVFKKVVIADRLAVYVNEVYGELYNYTGWPLIVATFFFAFQIYCDFSSYTDIALGTARILGFDLVENFRQPYLSRSVQEFWRRWHMSLTNWIREYVFMPLSRALLKATRMRAPRLVEIAAYCVTMLLVGLWHGFTLPFVVWGLLHGLYMSVETLPALKRWRLGQDTALRATLKMFVTFALVCFAWIFFRAETMNDALYVVGNLFNFGNSFDNLTEPFDDALFPQEIEFALALALVGLIVLVDGWNARRGGLASLGEQPAPLRWAVYYALALCIGLSLWFYVSGTQEFIYGQF